MTNPLREGLRIEDTPEPCVMVIFGATGDLTARKLMPALYNLVLERFLPPGFCVVAFARRQKSAEQFRAEMRQAVNAHSRSQPLQTAVWDTFAQCLLYHHAEFDDPQGYARLQQTLKQIDHDRGTGGNRVFYLATPPDCYSTIIHHLGAAGLVQSTDRFCPHESPSRSLRGWSRIIVEKPFGTNLSTARELNRKLLAVFREEQVFRIDHYLGKETTQNILVFRFGNGIFEPVWNRQFVDHVQITAAENIGVESRAGYFDKAGSLRDMVQNHILQLLALVALEPPASMNADAVRDERIKVLQALRPLSPSEVASDTVRGQYTEGSVGGVTVPGYSHEANVPEDSTTETFAALKVYMDNWRWAGVPFYLRTGKRLAKRVTDISIQFKRPPLHLFGETGTSPEANLLSMRIQPDEGISLRFEAKVPGQATRVRSVNMDFRYATSFGVQPPEAYERLLLDCMLGDATLFTRHDEVEAAWRFVDAVREVWDEIPRESLFPYPAGTWGPEEAHALIGRDGRRWRRL